MYNQYLMDSSINELNINWCGHSDIKMGKLYKRS